MTIEVGTDNGLDVLHLSELKPYCVITILECTTSDPDGAFTILQSLLRKEANKRSRALAVRLTGEVMIGGSAGDGDIADAELLQRFGFDRLYGITRERRSRPAWAADDSTFVDLTNELVVALRRDRLVAIRTDNPDPLLRWVNRGAAPYRRIPVDVMAATFDGDGKALWLRGIHRRRVTKADGKTLLGERLQEATDALEDASYVLTAMKVSLTPEEADAILRGSVTVSPDESRLSFKAMSTFPDFLAATTEALVMLDKSLTSETPHEMPFRHLAIRETDLTKVRGAYDIRVADPDELRGMPNAQEEAAARAEFLRDALLEVADTDPASAAFTLDVGVDGAVAGRLKIKPVVCRDSYELDVRWAGTASREPIAAPIKEAIGHGDLLSVYYESGHTFNGRQIARENQSSTPFPRFVFRDFTDFDIMTEKPKFSRPQDIHDNIAKNGDNSIFAWMVAYFHTGWLLCDDGSGEAADFLHLDNKGMLTSVDIKGANSKSDRRHISLTAFEQVASQAEKTARLLHSDVLADYLAARSTVRRACWYDGQRVADHSRFIDTLRTRTASDKTQVMIVQPHLFEPVYLRARAAADAGKPTRDSFSLSLLDTLLLGTRRTVTALWDDLTVIGAE